MRRPLGTTLARHRRARFLGPAAVLLGGLALSTPAAGDTRAGRVVAGPVVSGDGAAWVEARGAGRLAVRSARAHSAPRSVADLAPPRGGEFLIERFAGSAAGTALAVRQLIPTARECCQYPAVQLLTGPPDVGLREAVRCDPPDGGGFLPTVVAAGDAAAIQVRDCEELRRIGLRSFDGEPLAAPPSDGAGLIDAAGPYLAWSAAPGEVTVYDRARGAIAYTARGDGLGELGAVGLAPTAGWPPPTASMRGPGVSQSSPPTARHGRSAPCASPSQARVRLAGERVALSSQDPVGATLTF